MCTLAQPTKTSDTKYGSFLNTFGQLQTRRLLPYGVIRLLTSTRIYRPDRAGVSDRLTHFRRVSPSGTPHAHTALRDAPVHRARLRRRYGNRRLRVGHARQTDGKLVAVGYSPGARCDFALRHYCAVSLWTSKTILPARLRCNPQARSFTPKSVRTSLYNQWPSRARRWYRIQPDLKVQSLQPLALDTGQEDLIRPDGDLKRLRQRIVSTV